MAAYVVLEEGKELDPSILQTQLKSQLPDYMVPRLYMPLSELPLTANGKLDRGALPEPEGSALQRQAYVAPRTELERELASIWQGVLGVEQIGIYDDFFALGGDSIKAIQLRSRIRKLGYDLGVKDLFENATLEACAKQLRAARAVQSETGTLSGTLPLLPIQQRFFEGPASASAALQPVGTAQSEQERNRRRLASDRPNCSQPSTTPCACSIQRRGGRNKRPSALQLKRGFPGDRGGIQHVRPSRIYARGIRPVWT